MIRWTRTAQIVPGKRQEAIQWAQETREYTKTKFEGGADVKILLEEFGKIGVICWMADFENLAALELVGQVLDEDSEYQERLKASTDLFSDAYDKVYSSID
jgi:hypothetical protein